MSVYQPIKHCKRFGRCLDGKVPVFAESVLLTVCGHADSDAFLEATFLALVARDFVNGALGLILARVCRVQVLLNCASKKTL